MVRVAHRDAPAIVATWARQDHWNVPLDDFADKRFHYVTNRPAITVIVLPDHPLLR